MTTSVRPHTAGGPGSTEVLPSKLLSVVVYPTERRSTDSVDAREASGKFQNRCDPLKGYPRNVAQQDSCRRTPAMSRRHDEPTCLINLRCPQTISELTR